MTEGVSSALPKASHTPCDPSRSSILHVCTSCRTPGSPREPRENRAGFKLYKKLCKVLGESPLGRHVEVRPAECLSLCPRPCGIAFSSQGAWSYLFGDQHPDNSSSDILQCISLYISTTDGFMSREQRPKALRASILGRVPPQDGPRMTDEPLLTSNKDQDFANE